MADIIDIRTKLKKKAEEQEDFGSEADWEVGVDLSLDVLQQNDKQIAIALEDLYKDVEELRAIASALTKLLTNLAAEFNNKS